MQAGGILTLTAIGAELKRDTEVFGKMDPYLVIEYHGHKHKTHVHHNGGKHPHWNKTFELQVHSLSDDMIIKVFDEDMMSDDFVGMGIVKISSLVFNGGVNEWFDITYKERYAGRVHFQSYYKSSHALPMVYPPHEQSY